MVRSAPWFSAQGGAHGFECGDYDKIPLADKAILAVSFFAGLALLRSILIDVYQWRLRRADAYKQDDSSTSL